jgi:hypothetical protein
VRILLSLVVLSALAGAAGAYPQFQLSTDSKRCNQCHFSPSGGGLINNWGRSEAGDTISAGGNGGFLHGAWEPPAWLALGGDYRHAVLVNDVGSTEGAEVVQFPMQFDLYARLAVGSFSFYLNAGMRGVVRDTDAGPLSFLVSREHYFMWRPKPVGPYVRLGRFMTPFGLRIAEHPAYVRRFLGQNILEEPYALSGGVVEDDWELHLTAFTPDFIRPVGFRGTGLAGYYERRLGEDKVLGGQARVAFGPGQVRTTAGVVGKLWLPGPKILFMAELDGVVQVMTDADETRVQTVGFLGADKWLARGLDLRVSLELFDEDLAISATSKTAATVELQWFFHAHFELLFYGRAQLIGLGSGGDESFLGMLQLHYYL